jgi:2-amino-4-hydroxy-6-hydroxymethyldihydropteridine diphosphokinase
VVPVARALPARVPAADDGAADDGGVADAADADEAVAVPAPAEAWQPAYIGLGSNLGDSRGCIARAIASIAALPVTRVVAVSPCYRSAPFGPVAQSAFINAVAGILTRLAPLDLLRALRDLELKLGREAARVRWGPREIDLDVLVHGDTQLQTPELTLPHPGIPARDFVLYPLRDIAPTLHIPGIGLVAEIAATVANRGIERLD